MVAINILNVIWKMELDNFEKINLLFKHFFQIHAAQDMQEYGVSLARIFSCKTESMILFLYEKICWEKTCILAYFMQYLW